MIFSKDAAYQKEVVYQQEVTLWQKGPAAVEATRNTIAMLQGNVELVERGGKFYLSTKSREALRFAAWACARQGYVERVESEVLLVDRKVVP